MRRRSISRCTTLLFAIRLPILRILRADFSGADRHTDFVFRNGRGKRNRFFEPDIDFFRRQPSALRWTLTYPTANVTCISASAGAAATAANKTLRCSASSAAYTCLASGLNSGTIANGTVAVGDLTMAAGVVSTPIGMTN